MGDLEGQAKELEHGYKKLINDRLTILLYDFMKLTHSKHKGHHKVCSKGGEVLGRAEDVDSSLENAPL